MIGTIPSDLGALFSQPVANPGAGNPLDIIAPGGEEWRLHSIRVVFTTDATVVNRQVFLQWYNGITFGAQIWHNVNQAASLARTYHFIDWFTGVPFTTLSHFILPMGNGSLIDGIEYLRISADNLQAGDAFTDIVVNGERWLSD